MHSKTGASKGSNPGLALCLSSYVLNERNNRTQLSITRFKSVVVSKGFRMLGALDSVPRVYSPFNKHYSLSLSYRKISTEEIESPL